MNKLELINELTKTKDLSRPQARRVVEHFFEKIALSLAQGERMEIRGLFSFQVRKYKSYQGRNPKTGEILPVKAKKLPFFKCGRDLNDRVNKPNS